MYARVWTSEIINRLSASEVFHPRKFRGEFEGDYIFIGSHLKDFSQVYLKHMAPILVLLFSHLMLAELPVNDIHAETTLFFQGKRPPKVVLTSPQVWQQNPKGPPCA